MDDGRLGRGVRLMRVRRGWRQSDLAAAAGVSRQLVGLVESGRLTSVTVVSLRRVAEALGCRLELFLDSPGRDLDRLLNAHHGAMHEVFARLIDRSEGWVSAPEVSFSVYGERGVIDALIWHAASRSLVVVELKSAIVDVNDLLASMDRRRRLASGIARDRGWMPATVSVWVIVSDSRANRRRLASHATVLRGAFPDDGRGMRRFLRHPVGSIAALSFLSIDAVGGPRARLGRVVPARRRSSRTEAA
jgi:transcriptional regulator with XRE-family HTH domain